MDKLSVGLLVRLANAYKPAAMRQLARLVIEGRIPQPKDAKLNAKIFMDCAARDGDRKAGWLLCKYYLHGALEIESDMDQARYWRDRTERRLLSDTRLLYDDPSFQEEALRLYENWRRWLAKNWPSAVDQTVKK